MELKEIKAKVAVLSYCGIDDSKKKYCYVMNSCKGYVGFVKRWESVMRKRRKLL